MVELNGWLWQSLYTIKQMYDHGCADDILESFGNYALDGDMANEIASGGIEQIFADTRDYYNSEEEIETLVFFDPIITNFYQLCAKYEQKMEITMQENLYRTDMARAIRSGFSFDDYSYDYRLYVDPENHSGCKLVLLIYPEFCSYYVVPSGLLDIRGALLIGTERLSKELGEMEHSRPTELPITEGAEERMAA